MKMFFLNSVLHFTRVAICGHWDPSPQVRTYAPMNKETTARGDRHATVAKTATAQPVYSAQSPGRLAAVTPGLKHSNGFGLRVSLLP